MGIPTRHVSSEQLNIGPVVQYVKEKDRDREE